jgi:hypothetical protein
MTSEMDEVPAGLQAEPAADGQSLLGREPAAAPYEAFRLPEGASLDEAAMQQVTELFQQARLDQATAQRFVDLAMGREQAALQRGVQAFSDLQTKWTGEIKADPDIGGDRLTASLASAARAIDRLGVPGLREALNVTGAGNHPDVVRAFVRLGQMLAEDRFQPGRDAAPAPQRSPADIIYDGLPRQ